LLHKYGVNFTASAMPSMMIVFKLPLFGVSQPPDTFKKVANCLNYKK
jgi:hypothetical protein